MKLKRIGLSIFTLILIFGLLSGALAYAGESEPTIDHTQTIDTHGAVGANSDATDSDAEGLSSSTYIEATSTENQANDTNEQTSETVENKEAAETEGIAESKDEDQEKSEAEDQSASKGDEQTNAGGQAEKSKMVDLTPNAKSSILMDVDTGTIIYEKNIHEQVPPASITKVMTMLLIMEALDQKKITLDEMVTASEHAASMGGSQIFLEAGEQMSVRDLLKGVAMASGNDASVALAEKIAGSEEMFVQMMNEKAKELGMENTHFVNSNGLPAENHYSTAHDIAVMSRELLKYESITEYTGKYQDYLRTETENPFWLVNTNKLVRFYTGVDGLKTGYTSEAKFCLSATAKKDNLRVIAVVLGEPNTKTRNAEVASLFDFAFSQYTNMPIFETGDEIGSLPITKGEVNKVTLTAKHPYSVLLRKGEGTDNIRHELVLDESLQAPIAYGQRIGKIVVYRGDEVLTEFTLESPEEVAKAGWWTLFKRSAGKLFFIGE